MLKRYYLTTSTHNYIIGAPVDGRVIAYLVQLDLDGLGIIFSDAPTYSKEGFPVKKYRISKKKAAYLNAHASAIIDLCSVEELESSRRILPNKNGGTYKEDRGECFEWLMSLRLGTVQNDKQNLSHKDGGDFVANGVSYQVKYQGATIRL